MSVVESYNPVAMVFSDNAAAKVKGLIDYSLTPFNVGLAQTLEWYVRKIGDNQ